MFFAMFTPTHNSLTSQVLDDEDDGERRHCLSATLSEDQVASYFNFSSYDSPYDFYYSVMTIDKTWITERDRRSFVFKNGLYNFIEIAKNHLNDEGKTRCPCRRCANSIRSLQDLSTIYNHIHDVGFKESYTVWVHHGEEYYSHSEVESLFVSNTQTVEQNTNEMFDVLDDVIAEQNANEENIAQETTGLDSSYDALFKELNNDEFESEFPGRDLKANFTSWFRNNANTSSSDELMALAHGPLSAISYTACSFPTRTNSGEGGEPSFINDDDDEDEEAYSLDDDEEEEEEEINEDEANDDNDIVDTTYYSMADVSSRHHGGDGGMKIPMVLHIGFIPVASHIEATGRANYIDGWREMHSRNGNIENIHAQNAWVSHLALHL
ncbi:hypothetical protein QVD17_07409 [Tagetes erecta]|uniref:Transposase-associated domain-containing protein n=1 Tax=Tagetes erecta TaxID=13708 RepID=A0AAD8PCK4_TARER|nr:hypothetical protein QVD17_07409 [Tagetes erecta]